MKPTKILLFVIGLLLCFSLQLSNKTTGQIVSTTPGITVTLNPGEASFVNPADEFETNNQTHWRIDLNPYGIYDVIYLKEVYLYFIDKNGNEHRGSISQYFYKGIKMSLPDALSFPLSISVCQPNSGFNSDRGICPDVKGDSVTIFVTPPNVPLDTISQVGLFLQVTNVSNGFGVPVGVRIKAKSKGEIFKTPILLREAGLSFSYESIYEGLSYLKGFWNFPFLLNNTESPILREIIFINPNLPLTPTETTLSAPTSDPTSTEPMIELPAETPQIDPFAKEQILEMVDDLLTAINEFSKTRYYNKVAPTVRKLSGILNNSINNLDSSGNVCIEQINIIDKSIASLVFNIQKRLCIRSTSVSCQSATSFLNSLKEAKDTINSTLQIDNNEDSIPDACQDSDI